MIKALQGRTHAPGATALPRQSQNGKRAQPDPVGSLNIFNFFEHNVFFSNRDEYKLIPGIGLNTKYTHRHGNIPNIIWFWKALRIVFNIIKVIELLLSVYYLVVVYRCRISNSTRVQAGCHDTDYGNYSSFGIVDNLLTKC